MPEKSLSEMLTEAATFKLKPPPGMCGAIICLNAHKKQARANESIAHISFCRSTEFTASCGEQICIYCLTPVRAER